MPYMKISFKDAEDTEYNRYLSLWDKHIGRECLKRRVPINISFSSYGRYLNVRLNKYHGLLSKKQVHRLYDFLGSYLKTKRYL